MKKIAINGLGRIGRLALRLYVTNPPEHLSLVAANSPAPVEELAYLIRYDSVHGRAPFEIKPGEDYLDIGTQRIAIFHEKDPERLPWRTNKVDIVLECTGRHRACYRARRVAGGCFAFVETVPVICAHCCPYGQRRDLLHTRHLQPADQGSAP